MPVPIDLCLNKVQRIPLEFFRRTTGSKLLLSKPRLVVNLSIYFLINSIIETRSSIFFQRWIVIKESNEHKFNVDSNVGAISEIIYGSSIVYQAQGFGVASFFIYVSLVFNDKTSDETDSSLCISNQGSKCLYLVTNLLVLLGITVLA